MFFIRSFIQPIFSSAVENYDEFKARSTKHAVILHGNYIQAKICNSTVINIYVEFALCNQIQYFIKLFHAVLTGLCK